MSTLKRQDISEATSKFASYLMSIEPQAHIYHLQSNTYAEHIILNELYQEAPENVDTFIESYQGKYGKIYGYKAQPIREDNDPLAWIKEIRLRLESLRYDVCPKEEAPIQAEIDNVILFLNSIIYKLTNLK